MIITNSSILASNAFYEMSQDKLSIPQHWKTIIIVVQVMGVDTGAAGAAFTAPIISTGVTCRTIKIC